MLVHALIDLQSGDECTLPYLDKGKSLAERTKLLEHRGFTCTCELCVAQRRLRVDKRDATEQ
jgi:hypothetical protein